MKRLMRLEISAGILVAMFQQSGFRVMSEAFTTEKIIPEDAIVESIGINQATETFVIVLESSSFAPVQEGEEIPNMESPEIWSHTEPEALKNEKLRQVEEVEITSTRSINLREDL